MKYFAYSLVFVAALFSVLLVPSETNTDVKYADAPRLEQMTVQNVRLVCVDSGRCFDVRKLPARYRATNEQANKDL